MPQLKQGGSCREMLFLDELSGRRGLPGGNRMGVALGRAGWGLLGLSGRHPLFLCTGCEYVGTFRSFSTCLEDLTVKIKKNEWKRKKQKQEQRGLSSSGFENRPPVGRKRPQVQGWQRPEHREMSGEDKEPLLGEPESSREKG